MRASSRYDSRAVFHWDHLAGSCVVACVTILAISFTHVVWLYDTALEAERLLYALLRDGASFGEVMGTAPPGQGLIAVFVVLVDSAVGRMLPGVEMAHDILRVMSSAFATKICLSALINYSRSSWPDAKWASISFTLLVALGPFALLLSQVGVSTMICLAAAAQIIRVVFGLDRQPERVGMWAPIYVLVMVSFAGWPAITLSVLLFAVCLVQALLFRDKDAALTSGFAILLAFAIGGAVLTWAPDWPVPARSWAMPYMFLAMGLPFLVVAGALLSPDILRARENLQSFTLPIVTMLILFVLVVCVGDNLLAASALLMLAYAKLWGLSTPSFTHETNDPYFRPRETVWAIGAWLIGPITVVGAYALSAGAVWSFRTISLSGIFCGLCLAALAIFVRLRRTQNGSRWALILTSVGAVLFIGGVASVPMREAHGPASLALAQQVWKLCRDNKESPAIALIGDGIDPLTQRLLGPARRGPTDGVDLLHIRRADAAAPDSVIDLVQMRQPGLYIAAIVAPSEAARTRCGSN